jgi:hypothetical protein
LALLPLSQVLRGIDVDEHEEYEHVPWSELLAEPPQNRRRAGYLVATAVAALVLGVLVARAWFSSSTQGTPVAGGFPTSTVETPPNALEATTSTVRSGSILQEADLMAFAGGTAERAAVARAEWFVTDYFTADLEPFGSSDVRTALPSGSALPEMPQDTAGGLSYVEWARAFRVEEIEEGLFAVGVVFRSLGAPPDRGFLRLGVRAVEVRVNVGPDGGSSVADLPSPAVLPAAPEPIGWPESTEEAPEQVTDEVLELAAGWGEDPRLLASQRMASGWRLVVSVADEVGNRWPMSIQVDEAGNPTGNR